MISIYYIIIRNSKKRETLHFYTALINNPDPKDPALGCPLRDFRLKNADFRLKSFAPRREECIQPQSAIYNLKPGTHPQGGSPQDKS
jgi:hypothetical protein